MLTSTLRFDLQLRWHEAIVLQLRAIDSILPMAICCILASVHKPSKRKFMISLQPRRDSHARRLHPIPFCPATFCWVKCWGSWAWRMIGCWSLVRMYLYLPTCSFFNQPQLGPENQRTRPHGRLVHPAFATTWKSAASDYRMI